jgi:hypothetical protein
MGLQTRSGAVSGAMALALSGALDTASARYRIDLTPRLSGLDLGGVDYSASFTRPTGKPKNEKRAARNKAARKSRKLNRRR